MFQYVNCLSVSLFSLNNKHRIAYHIQYGISTLRVTPSTAERKITNETVSNYRDGVSFHRTCALSITEGRFNLLFCLSERGLRGLTIQLKFKTQHKEFNNVTTGFQSQEDTNWSDHSIQILSRNQITVLEQLKCLPTITSLLP